MTIHTTRWSPDTCECIVEYQWNDQDPEDTRVHTPSNIVNKCAAHVELPDTTSVFNTVLEENPRKNFAIQNILDNAPNTNWYDTDAPSGNRVLKNNVRVNWSWTGTGSSRNLTLNFSGVTLTNQQRNTLQNILNNRFGNNKVVIQTA